MATATGRTIEDALQAMVNAYQKLTLENGYAHNVKYVSRHVPPVDVLESIQTPAIFVARPLGTTGEMTHKDKTLYREDVTVAVVGFIRNKAGLNADRAKLATKGEIFLSDLKRVQLADPSFGVPKLIKNSILVDDSNDAAWDNEGVVVSLGITIITLWDVNNV